MYCLCNCAIRVAPFSITLSFHPNPQCTEPAEPTKEKEMKTKRGRAGGRGVEDRLYNKGIALLVVIATQDYFSEAMIWANAARSMAE